ncbi:SRPBCC family protein [Verrucomicrobium spinosum]|uniref:SRPBCC family protein n=1 Tax=Verrucomicrobium spinosum TaxID=2736 RepID=UPI00094660B9|nr:SRPBCC family protein [Verrucomicrobium spinosum]
MNSVEESIRIERPVKVVYDQWTQFEDFPHFMEGVKEVRQIDDSHLHWEVEMGGFIKTWEAEIIEQVPDQFIAWQSTHGPRSSGRVTFEPLADDATMVSLRMAYTPEGVVENLGAFSASFPCASPGTFSASRISSKPAAPHPRLGAAKFMHRRSFPTPQLPAFPHALLEQTRWR